MFPQIVKLEQHCEIGKAIHRGTHTFDGMFLGKLTFNRPLRFFLAVGGLLFLTGGKAQDVEVKGIIYDFSQKNPLEAVSVMSTSGTGTITDVYGRYSIWVRATDSLFFSYQGRETGKYPVLKMEDVRQFNMALHVQVYALPNVIVRPPNYQMDSLNNRREYSEYFDYSKPNPLKSINVGPTGVGMDPNEIINMFRFKRNRSLASLQRRLVNEEQDKYIDFRFNKRFVTELTGMQGEELTLFMRKYRPPYDFVAITNQLEFGYYIQQCYKKEKGILPANVPLYDLWPFMNQQ